MLWDVSRRAIARADIRPARHWARARVLALVVLAALTAFPPLAGPLGHGRVEARTGTAPGSMLLAPSGLAVTLGQWMDLIRQAADESGVPWQVVAAVMIIESNGNPDLVSPSGAIGLMQVDPKRWQASVDQFGGDLKDPLTNLRTGAAILAGEYATWGAWDQAAAAFAGVLDAEGNVTSALVNGVTGQQYVASFRRQLANLGYSIGPVESSGVPFAAQADVLQIASSTLGTPYVWGGESYAEGGFDCSGLVQWAYAQLGKGVPRTAAEQWAAIDRLEPTQVLPGDLIFFYNTYELLNVDGSRITRSNQLVITHVGFYAGNGLMLHAPKEGDVVRLVSLDTPFWRTHLAGYGRVT